MKRKRPNQQTRTEAGTEVRHIDNSLLIHEGQNRRKEKFHLHATMKRKRPNNQQTRSEARTKVLDIDKFSLLIHEEHKKLCLMLEADIVEDKFKRIKQWFDRYIGRRELERIVDFCDLYQCLYDREIIDLGEYQELSKALNAVGLQRLGKEIKKTSETIRKIRIKKRNSSGSKRKGSIQKTIVKKDWISVRRKWSRIADELLDRRGNKLLKRNFEQMANFFYDMNDVMKSEDLDVKLTICSGVTGKVKNFLDKKFTETALTNAQALKRATCVFVKRYDATVIIAAQGCLRLTLRFTTSSALEMMWDDYLSGDLSNMLTDNIVTIHMKEMADWEDIFVGVEIDKRHYLNVCRSLLSGMNFFEKMTCKSTDDTKEDDDYTPFDFGTFNVSSHVTGEISQVKTEGWGHRQQHLSPHQKRGQTEVSFTRDRPLSVILGDDNEHKSDSTKETKRCLQHTTSPAIASVEKYCTGLDEKTKCGDDENGPCVDWVILNIPIHGEISQVDKDGCENVLKNLSPDQKWGQPEDKQTPHDMVVERSNENVNTVIHRYGLPLIQAHLLRQVIMAISDHVSFRDVRMLARAQLGIPDAKLDNIEFTYPHDTQEQSFQILWMWKERTAGATVHDLFKALKDHQLNASLDKVMDGYASLLNKIRAMPEDEFQKFYSSLQLTKPGKCDVTSPRRGLMCPTAYVSEDMKYLTVPIGSFMNSPKRDDNDTARAVVKYRLIGKDGFENGVP